MATSVLLLTLMAHHVLITVTPRHSNVAHGKIAMSELFRPVSGLVNCGFNLTHVFRAFPNLNSCERLIQWHIAKLHSLTVAGAAQELSTLN